MITAVRPAPRREPPFDDEITTTGCAVGPLDQPLPFEPVVRQSPFPRSLRADRSDLPDPVMWGRRLIVGIIETAGGRRPLQQLSTVLSASVARGLSADLDQAARGRRPHWTHAATVRSVRAAEPRDGVAELCATVQAGSRIRAIAIRAEAHHGRWRCTRLQLG